MGTLNVCTAKARELVDMRRRVGFLCLGNQVERDLGKTFMSKSQVILPR